MPATQTKSPYEEAEQKLIKYITILTVPCD